MDLRDRFDTRAPTWVCVGVVVLLAVPQLVTGLWAVLAPEDWYQSFPGFDPRLVAAFAPFNPHLATDAGAGFLATGVALLVGSWFARRSTVYVALLSYLAFAVPHTLYHTQNPARALTGGEDAANVTLLWGSVVFALVGLWGARPTINGRTEKPSPPPRPVSETPSL